MITNCIIRLNKALIQLGRVNKKFKLGLTDKKITANLFCFIFKSIKDNIALSKNTPLDVLVEEDRKVDKAVRS